MTTRTIRALALLALWISWPAVPASAGTPTRVPAAAPSSPTLAFLTRLGGSRGEMNARVAVGGSGNIFLAGSTSSTDWPAPWSGPCALSGAWCAHVFLQKLAPDGVHVYYTLLLGGSRNDYLTGLAVDRAGNAYLTGNTTSPDFRTLRPLQAHCAGADDGGCDDGFAAKVDPQGHLLYSTFLGGKGDDHPTAISVDRSGDAYVAGSTDSPTFPTVRAMQPRPGGKTDGFVTKIDPSGRRLLYSTFLGGSGEEGIAGIAVDALGQAYVTGSTTSPNLRTSARSLQPGFVGGNCGFFPCSDAFVAKLGTAGRFLAGTFLATPANDEGHAVAVDGQGNVYVAGSTGSSSIPSAIPTVMTGKHYCGEEGDIFPCQSAFVVELSPWLEHLAYSRMLSGDGLDRADALTVDARGAAVVGGYTESDTFPTVRPTQGAIGGGECSEGKGGSAPCDGFVTAIAPHGRSLTFSTYVGGAGEDDVTSVALDGRGGIVMAGSTTSSDLPPVTGSTPLTVPTIFLGRIAGGGTPPTSAGRRLDPGRGSRPPE